jgi:hypothetical protein
MGDWSQEDTVPFATGLGGLGKSAKERRRVEKLFAVRRMRELE